MPAVLACLLCAALAVSEVVTVELIKTVGIIIAAGAAVASALIGARGRRELQRRRHEVRDPDSEHVVVVDHPPDVPAGAYRRSTDPPPKE